MSNPTTTTIQANVSTSDIGNKPPSFSGKKSEARRFKLLAEAYLRLNINKYDTDEKKVWFFLGLLNSGIAATWSEMVMEKIIADEDVKKKNAGHVMTYDTLTKVSAAFDKKFNVTDAKGEAQADLEKLRQGKDTVETYSTTFDILAPKTEYDEEALIYFFKRGLRSDICDQASRIYPRATDLETWQKYAHDMDSMERGRIEEKRRWNTFTYFRPTQATQQTTQTTKTSTSQHVPMDVDAVQYTPLTQPERERLRRSGGCFYCRQQGHMAKECPNRGQRTQARPVRAIEPTRTASIVEVASTSSTSAPSQASTSTGTNDIVKVLTDVGRQIQGLSGDGREQAIALFKDIAATMKSDF